MPIEIRELHIRVSVTPPARPGSAPAAAGGTAADPAAQEALVAECVERVLEVLRNREER